jgi:hypothetical protein
MKNLEENMGVLDIKFTGRGDCRDTEAFLVLLRCLGQGTA